MRYSDALRSTWQRCGRNKKVAFKSIEHEFVSLSLTADRGVQMWTVDLVTSGEAKKTRG